MLPTSSAVPPTAAAIGDRSPTASDSEESEYEEVEIEEEIEVEEEVTGDEEEEDGGDEVLSRSIEDPDDEKRKTTIICNDEKSCQCDGGIITADTTNPVNKSSKQVNASDKVPHSEEQTTQVNRKDVNDAQQMESRLVRPIRPRRLPPTMEFKEGNKRPAFMCLSEGTRSNLAISSATIITYSSEIKPASQKETPATISSFNDMNKDNNSVKLLVDQSAIFAGKTTIISNDKISSQFDVGFMTAENTNHVNESSTKANASDKTPLPHSEEQTTQVNTKDVDDAHQKESRLDVYPAMEIKEGNEHPVCINDTTNSLSKKRKVHTGLVCPDNLTCASVKDRDQRTPSSPAKSLSKKRELDTGLLCPNRLTDASNEDHDQQAPSPPAKSSLKKRKKRSKDRKLLLSDLGLSFGEGAGRGPSITDEVCHEILNHTVPPGEIRSSQQVTRMHVSDRAGCLMVQAMGSVSQLIKCYDKKVETEKRLRERIKRYRAQMKQQAEENLKKIKRLKKLKSSRRSMSEKVNETLRMMAEKEAEHKKEVHDLMEKLEKAYRSEES